MKKIIMLGLALTLAIVLAACGDDNAEGDKKKDEQTQEEGNTSKEGQEQQVKVTDKEKVEEGTAVASVNGDEIKGERYNPIYTQLKTQMAQYGQDVSDLDKLKEQTINVLVEQHLIRQDAASKGIKVSDKEVQSEFDSLKEENGDQLTAVLEQFNLTEDQFKRQLEDDLITTKYIDSQLEVKVTDKEVEEYYNQLKEQNEEIGKLKDLKDQIKNQIKQQKTNEQLQKKVDKLKKDAKVETLI
ncbi:SurA N-terminal domain-containing protein [Virgibacillus sp. Bac332]|uniref:SurA N-terminal domain-containing protein n=1 Tax=Virgibacillus sp. Bac332 TaxID=2419842 RepID=UPI000EF46730|nr:SurA N-terminal domain-containing protein [Virgibacillus sp. Bac332]